MKLPSDTDIPRFETLLFQWANSLCQGASLPLPVPLKSLSEKMRVIFLSTPPVNEEQICDHFGYRLGQLNRTNELCRIYSETCVELCRELEVKVIDLWSEIQKQSDWLTTCFTDGIHLSSEGSKIVVREILKALKETDWEPHLHWKSLSTEFAEDSPHYPLCPDGKTTLNFTILATLHQLNVQWKLWAELKVLKSCVSTLMIQRIILTFSLTIIEIS